MVLRASSVSSRIMVAIDFDGTLFEHHSAFPLVGDPKTDVIQRAIDLQKHGVSLILWTCRSGPDLARALVASKSVGLVFDAVNENPWSFDSSRKIYATLYVDDRSPGSIEYFLNEFNSQEKG